MMTRIGMWISTITAELNRREILVWDLEPDVKRIMPGIPKVWHRREKSTRIMMTMS